METRPRLTIYYGPRRFLLLAPTFVLEPVSPYRRLSWTLLLARKKPFLFESDGGVTSTVRAVLVSPKVPRRRIAAIDSDLAIFDLPLRARPGAEPVEELALERFTRLLPALDGAFDGTLSCDGVDALFDGVTEVIVGRTPQPTIDARVEAALRLIDEWPFEAVNLEALARHLALSPSRLRHLFKDATGHTVSHYARWTAVWRGIALWSKGRRLTDIAHEVGFHDLSHLDRAFIEVFGLNPSSLTRPDDVTLVRCPSPVWTGQSASSEDAHRT